MGGTYEDCELQNNYFKKNTEVIVLKFMCLSRFEWLSATDERHICEFLCTCISPGTWPPGTTTSLRIGLLVEFHKHIGHFVEFLYF